MSRVKSISLDDRTWEIAARMPNLSHFVRECLLRYEAQVLGSKANHMDDHPIKFGDEPICKPNTTKTALCFICWPNGRPSDTEWSAAMSHLRHLAWAREHPGRMLESNPDDPIPELMARGEDGMMHIRLEPDVLAWIQKRAIDNNPEPFPLHGFSIQPKKARAKPKRWIDRVMGR